jgi:Tfp pilus assembly protein PilN
MLNLLPLEYKKKFKEEENWKVVLILEMLFLIFLISLILVLFSVKIYVQGQVESLKIRIEVEEKILQMPEMQGLRAKLATPNQDLSKLESFYRSQAKPTEILEKIFQTMSSGIHLTSFSWQENTSRAALSGFSPSREILFKFKNNLEEKKEFEVETFPESNWIKPTNINFNLTFRIK